MLKKSILIASLFVSSFVINAQKDTTEKSDEKGKTSEVKKSEKPHFEGKTYSVMQYQIRDEVRGKSIKDEIQFSSGKVRSMLMYDLFDFNQGKYKVLIDSTYSDGDDVFKYLTFEAEITNKKEEVMKMTGIVDGNYLDGFIEIYAKGKLKKKYEYSGMLGKMKKD